MIMIWSRLMNTLLALVLILGQLVGGVHLASHAEPVHATQQAHTTAEGPKSKIQEKSECAACHFAAHLLIVTASRFTALVDLSTEVHSAPYTSASVTAAFLVAYAIRGPPAVS